MNRFNSLIFLFFLSFGSITAQDSIGIVYLFDISKSYKIKALDEAIEVSENIYNTFTEKKGGLGSISPQYHLTSTIDAKSIKATKPCTTTYVDESGGVFSKKSNNDNVIVDIGPCLNKISNLPYSMYTDIRGGVYNAGNSLGNNIAKKGLIIFSDMENDPAKSFQKNLPLDLNDITVIMLYSHTLSGKKGNITDKFVEDFKAIFREAGAKDVEAWPLQSVAVQGRKGSLEVVKFFLKSFKR